MVALINQDRHSDRISSACSEFWEGKNWYKKPGTGTSIVIDIFPRPLPPAGQNQFPCETDLIYAFPFSFKRNYVSLNSRFKVNSNLAGLPWIEKARIDQMQKPDFYQSRMIRCRLASKPHHLWVYWYNLRETVG